MVSQEPFPCIHFWLLGHHGRSGDFNFWIVGCQLQYFSYLRPFCRMAQKELGTLLPTRCYQALGLCTSGTIVCRVILRRNVSPVGHLCPRPDLRHSIGYEDVEPPFFIPDILEDDGTVGPEVRSAQGQI